MPKASLHREPSSKAVRAKKCACYHGRVSGAKLSVLIVVFFFTSVISVVTGSTSLITVPVMIALGIEAHVAVATNMLALTFMSVGGSLAFVSRGVCFTPPVICPLELMARMRKSPPPGHPIRVKFAGASGDGPRSPGVPSVGVPTAAHGPCGVPYTPYTLPSSSSLVKYTR